MAVTLNDSQVSLIQLEETRTTRIPTPIIEEGLVDETKFGNNEKSKNSFLPSMPLGKRKNRKVANDGTEKNGKVSSSWTEHDKISSTNKKPKIKINNKVPKNGHLSDNNKKRDNSNNADDEEKQTFLSWLKSKFVTKNKDIDISKSNKKKMMYFGLVLPTFVFLPEALEQSSAAKFGEDFQLHLAAAHIDDALDGRGKFGKARAAMKSKNVQKCFKIISSPYWEYLLYLFIALHCFMPFWEQSPTPTPIGATWSNSWDMPIFVLVIDALCMTVYVIDITLSIVFISWRHFWKAKENFWLRVEFTLTGMFIIDYIILVLEKILVIRLIAPFRCLRAAMLLCKSQNVAHIFKVLVSITAKLGKVFSIIFIFIFTFASIGLHLYMDDYHEIPEVCTNETTAWNCTNVYSGAFDHVAIASLHMFVLMSTENYPDVIIPAYDVSVANFFYFMFYLYAGVFFLTAILLAIIVESYWEYSKKHVKLERLRQREELIKAWNLLDLNGSGFLSVDDPKLLKLFKILRPKNSEDENLELLEYISDSIEDYIIESYDWTTRLVDALRFEFEPETEDEDKETDSHNQTPSKWTSIQQFTRKIIHANRIGIAILMLILLHSVLFCLMWNGITGFAQEGIQIFRSVILFMFILEILLRMISDGTKLLNMLDLLDMFMVFVAVTGNVLWYILWYTFPRSEVRIYLGACIVASSLAVLARLLFNSEQARSAIYILRSIYPVMFDLILLVIIIIYFYAILGLEIFQDQTLEKSKQSGFEGSYVQYGCGVGFETFGCAMMVVFQIVTTNDWHQIMLGAMIDAGWASSFYFVTCYLFINMIVMNLFVAISIEAYKKLARDSRDMAMKPEPTKSEEEEEKSEEETETPAEEKLKKKKYDRSLGAAKEAFTGLFASTRVRKTSSNVQYGGASPNTHQMSRRGPRGSIATVSLKTQSGDDNSDDDTIFSIRSLPGTPRKRQRSIRERASTEGSPRKRFSSTNTPETPGLRKTSSIKEPSGRRSPSNRRQGMMKARSEQKRRERKARQQQQTPPDSRQENNLHVPSPKLSMSDVVKLKRMVKVIAKYKARTYKEMSLEEGQMLSVTEEKNEMYKGPSGWFPKTHIVDVAMEVNNGGPFKENNAYDSPSSSRRRKTGKVKFMVENETNLTDKPSSASSSKSLGTTGQQPLHHRNSQLRMRKKVNLTDWRRDILGDMTVMNRDEMQELSKRLRGGNENFQRRQQRVTTGYRPPNLSPRRVEQESIQESIEEEDLPAVPELTVSEALSSQHNTSESDESITKTSNTETGTLTLTVPGTVSKKKPNKSGEMPDWAKNFAALNNLEVQDNAKFDDAGLPSSSAGSSEDESRSGSIAGVIVHRSDTNTSSSVNNTPDNTETNFSQAKSSSNSDKTDNALKTNVKLEKKIVTPSASSKNSRSSGKILNESKPDSVT
uniref:voltage-dependent P/Q-type calcium channel subunit alpha-1A-like isoform X1 n=2 Tax=Styela clava TaxID=7725 RepID=UPI00193ACD89|nr:voltage-dependent P/Q-type calcium channel subunit alpha-1A-like isoform X1 [Styela clava]